jgi:type II secretory pathway pseudopilin PulG
MPLLQSMKSCRTDRRSLKIASRVVAAEAFTLIEVMLAVGIMALVLTTATVSLRSKWRAEQTRRAAQQVSLMWLKTQSQAWREGREWVMSWDSKSFQLTSTPFTSAEEVEAETTSSDSGQPAASFHATLDRSIEIFSEGADEESISVHFLPNGRVRHTSLLVKGPKDSWRVRGNWAGHPILENASETK